MLNIKLQYGVNFLIGNIFFTAMHWISVSKHIKITFLNSYIIKKVQKVYAIEKGAWALIGKP